MRLARVCDSILEAGWLAALVVTPLFFNLLSARTFEPDKAALLRVIALVMLAAGAVVLGNKEWGLGKKPSIFSLQSLAILLAVVYILSAALGLNARISFLGSYNRDQGVVTLVAYLLLFLVVGARLRTREQVGRLLDTVVLVSLPLAVYALLQRLGADPIPWGGYGAAVTSRVIGTQGNATFLGGYLALAIPVTLYQWLQARRQAQIPRQVVYGAAVVLAALALVFSDSRGAALGLALGLTVWALTEAAWRGQRRLAQAAVGLGVAGVLLLVVLNLAGGVLQGVPLLGRLGRLLDPAAGSSQVRILVWQGMSDMILAHPERLALGTGPDAFYLGYYPYFPVDARRLDNPLVGTHDRSHNEVLDRLAGTGVVGLAVWLLLVGGLFYAAVKQLGLAPSARARQTLVGALVSGAILGAAIPTVLIQSLRYSGLGLGVGLVLGLVAWLAGRALTATPNGERNPALAVLPMLLGALVAHCVDIQVGPAVTATETLFWVLAGLVVSGWWVGKEDAQLDATQASSVPSTTPKATQPVGKGGKARRPASRPALSPQPSALSPQPSVPTILFGLMAGLILVTLTYGFVVRGVNLTPALLVLVLLGIVTLTAGAALAPSPGLFLGVAAGVWILYLIVHLLIALPSPNPGPPAFTLFVVVLLAWLVGFGLLRQRPRMAETMTGKPSVGIALGVPALLLALVGLWNLSLQPIYADSYVRIGQLYSQLGRWNEAVAAYEEAITRAPAQDFFLPNAAQAYLAQAQTASDPTTRETAFERSRALLREANRLSPRNPEYLVNLGAAEQYWADKWATSDTKAHLQDMAGDKYKLAVELAPRDPHALRRWGRLKLDQQQPAEAIPLLEKSLSLLLPDGTTTVVQQTRQIVAETRTDLARAYQAVGRTADAITQARTALSLAPDTARQPIEDLLKQLGASGS
ncbi:MAG: tetratricopeptide repeat protein [Anaerolineae bacterium]|nr:tetratricopeptide repeat protein [Anaerolineae bacterium]